MLELEAIVETLFTSDGSY